MAIHYNGNAKILFYIGGKKLIKKRHRRYFAVAFYIILLWVIYSVLAFFTFCWVSATVITSLISLT